MLKGTHTTRGDKCKTTQTAPFLKVGVVLWVVLVTGVLQGFVEVKGIFLIDIHWSQVCASTKPPLLRAWNKEDTRQTRKKETRVIIHSNTHQETTADIKY